MHVTRPFVRMKKQSSLEWAKLFWFIEMSRAMLRKGPSKSTLEALGRSLALLTQKWIFLEGKELHTGRSYANFIQLGLNLNKYA